jgi:cytochrome c oxidase cbb3-type subunit 1
VHTNLVFWGWASLSMIALALFVVPRTSQRKIYSTRIAWVSLSLINISVLSGVVLLLGGANNGGQEYREFIWPVMGLFMIALILLTYDFYQTVARRSVKEIYISNWYIMAAFLWTLVLMIVSYLPWYQYGLGETVIQGYYMHMGVGMWFTPMVLGLTYYFLPKLLNKPIYSYSLGVLAFWTQMVFYTMIGAHHFVFSPIPWWLQTVAIIFSVGMFIPLIAGTGNFLLTMKGSEGVIARSYSLPFIFVGVLYYFLASGQGTFEAFRSMNRLWHFTNFTIAHLTYDDVRIHLLPYLGRHLRTPATADRKRTFPFSCGCPLLACAGRRCHLRSFPYDRGHGAGQNVDFRSAFYRFSEGDVFLLAVEGGGGQSHVFSASRICL